MRVHVEPAFTMSQAMFRVARQLVRYAPSHVKFTQHKNAADFHVLHAIGADALEVDEPDFAAIQYCMKTAGGSLPAWQDWWSRSRVVWSYYGLDTPKLYHAPLGVDGDTFVWSESRRDVGIVTTGYVSGPDAEAIEEVALAASMCGLTTVHLGPDTIQGMEVAPTGWTNVNGITDDELAHLYGRARWVSGLRHVEGFELPVLEGLVCGARPIVFDRPEMREWYDGHAMFIPECSGEELVNIIGSVLICPPPPVTEDERREVLEKFNWETIVNNFWKAVGV